MDKYELVTIDDVYKAVRGHTKVRSKRLERVGPGSHRTERRKKATEEEEGIEKARTRGAKDIKKRKKKGVKRATSVEKFSIGIKFDKPPRVEKFRGGVGIRFD